MGKKIYTCYVKLSPEKVQANETITGNKKDVLAWMKAKFGKLSETEMVQTEAFFYDGDCTEFRLADERSVFLAELLDDDEGPVEDGPEGEDLDDPEEEGPEEEYDDGPEEDESVGEDLDDPEEEDDIKREREMAEQARKRREEEDRADRERREKERQQQLAEQERLRKETEKAAAAKLEAERALREAAEAKAAAELAKKEAELKSSQAKMQSQLSEQQNVLARVKAAMAGSPQKRWLFIVLGILGGWLGLHLAYARRWVLFALFWVSAIAFFAVVPAGAKSSPLQTPFALAVVALWLGGTFFIKKDGKKRCLS